MNEQQDPLEIELSAVRPQPISAELRRRIAERLAEPVLARSPVVCSPVVCSPSVWRRVAVGSLSTACLSVACLFAIALWWTGGQNVVSPPETAGPGPSAAGSADVAEPTLLAYQRALERSAEELDSLLNRHALATPFYDPQLIRVGAFTRSDAALHTLLGDD